MSKPDDLHEGPDLGRPASVSEPGGPVASATLTTDDEVQRHALLVQPAND